MNKRLAPGMFIIFVISMILVSGCSGTVSPDTCPVTTLPPQTHNGTVTATTAPVSVNTTSPPAQVSTTQLPTTTPLPPTAAPAATAGAQNNVSKKNATPAITATTGALTGALVIHIRAGGSADGLKVFIARDGSNLPPVEYSYRPDRTIVEGPNSGYLAVKVLSDGVSEVVRLAPGRYTAYLPSMNVGRPPEEQSFLVRDDEITQIWFDGYMTSSGGCGC